MDIKLLRTYDAYAKTCVDMLSNVFEDHYSKEESEQEIKSLLKGKSLLYVAINKEVIGFVGAIDTSYPAAYELHPLIVKVAWQRQGIGRKLLEVLEEDLANKGVLTLYLGTDDECFATSLSDGDLYQDTYQKLSCVKNYKDHPFGFYQKCGYTIVGVIPDANGLNKPDIIMAKRLHTKNKRE